MTQPTALIAEDEPLLAQALQAELLALWPELHVLAIAPDGPSAVAQALHHLPALLFLDIRMPGQSGLEAAQSIVEDWPDASPLPLIVFVTAYDQYALAAFEQAAIDYVLKPVKPARLAQTCQRLQAALASRQPATHADPLQTTTAQVDEALLLQLRSLLEGPLRGLSATVGTSINSRADTHRPAPLQVIQAAVGHTIHMVPVEDVVCFEAADKYVRVLTADKEHLIRISLKELLPQLDEQRFWQVHRSVVVQAVCIERAVKDEAGRVHLHLRGRPEKVPVSRIYASRFKGM